MSWIWWIIVGLIAGWATGRIMKGSGYGPIMDIVLGIIGGVIGGWIMTALGVGVGGGLIWSIIVAIIGAVILVWIVRLITGNRTRSLTLLFSSAGMGRQLHGKVRHSPECRTFL